MQKNCISIYNEFSNIGPTRRTWTWRIKVKLLERYSWDLPCSFCWWSKCHEVDTPAYVPTIFEDTDASLKMKTVQGMELYTVRL